MAEVKHAIEFVLAAPPEEVAAEIDRLREVDVDAAVRVEGVLRMLVADEVDVPFWQAIIGGHREGRP